MIQPQAASNIASKVLGDAWGNIPRVDWIRSTATFVPDGEDWLVEVDVQVEPHIITRRIDRNVRGVPRIGGVVRGKQRISGYLDTPIVKEATMEAIRYASGLLREADPRIGLMLTEGHSQGWAKFPRGALFDPPRMRPPSWTAASMDSVPCSLCDGKFGSGLPAMWAGGNLLWCHAHCWIELHVE